MRAVYIIAFILGLAGGPFGEAAEPKWTPPDRKPFGYFWHRNHIAVEYQYRIEFFSLPADYQLEADGFMKVKIVRPRDGRTEAVDLSKQAPAKVIRFRRRFHALNRVAGAPSGPYVLVCTDAISSRYSPVDANEHAKSGSDPHGVEWMNPELPT